MEHYFPDNIIGILGTRALWISSFGSVDSCTIFKNYPVYYHNPESGVATFDNWNDGSASFGGWKKPADKKYTTRSLCGYTLELTIKRNSWNSMILYN